MAFLRFGGPLALFFEEFFLVRGWSLAFSLAWGFLPFEEFFLAGAGGFWSFVELFWAEPWDLTGEGFLPPLVARTRRTL